MASPKFPKSMRALVHAQDRQILTLIKDFPIPSPKPDEHLLQVSATAICKGELLWPRPQELNESHPGVEMSGTVVTAPPNSKFPPGSKIYARAQFPRAGFAREFAIGYEHELALRPQTISAEEASAVPVSGLTAWQGLFVHGGLKSNFDRHTGKSASAIRQKGTRVLVNGASGAVGMWMIQLAHAAGCAVVGTCSTANEKIVRAMGADDIIDYTKTSIADWMDKNPDKKCDLVLDTVGSTSLSQAWHAAKEHGLVLSIVPRADMVWKWDLDRPEGVSETVKGRFYIMEPSTEQLGRISELIEQTLVKPKVDSVWAMEDFKQAFRKVDDRHTVGKVVLKVQERIF